MLGLRVGHILVVAALLCVAMEASAQIKVIPREQIEQIANPQTLSDAGMFFTGGQSVDLGCVAEADGVTERVVEWENRGKKPLVITRIKSSCSCLSVDGERDVVAPGEKGTLRLRFNPHQRLGGVSYRVLIYSSLSDKVPTAMLSVTGEVLSSADRADDYAERCGALLLMSRRVKITSGVDVRVVCMNGGDEPLLLEADDKLSGRGVELRTEPRVLAAGEQGDLVIRYDAVKGRGDSVIMLYIKGLPLPPRQRCIVLELEK